MPLAYRPWDRPAAPVKAPADEVSQVDDAQRRLTNTLLNLARGDGDVAERTGYRAPAGKAGEVRVAAQEKKRREAETRLALEQVRQQIEERNRRITENLERIAVLDRQESALQRHLDSLARGEKPELDEAGHLKDKDAEAAIREYEKRYGVKVDRNDPEQIAAVLRNVQDERIKLQRENEDLTQANERDRQRALELGADPASIPATVRAAERSEPERRSIDAATAAMTSEDQRLAVVDAKGYSAAGQTDAVAAVSAPEDYFSDGATVAPTGGTSAANLVAPTPIQAPDLGGAFASAVMAANVVPTPTEPTPDRAAIKPTAM